MIATPSVWDERHFRVDGPRLLLLFCGQHTSFVDVKQERERERETRVDIETKIGKKDALMAWVRKRDNDIRCR